MTFENQDAAQYRGADYLRADRDSDAEPALRIRATTVLVVRRGEDVVMAADGQVSMNQTVVKHGASKLRRMHQGKVLAGFAGSTADALTLFELCDAKLRDHQGNLRRALVEMAKAWRTDRMLRRLEALLLVASAEHTFLVSGTGDVIEPDDGVMAVGSGGNHALAAARALMRHTELSAEEVACGAMEIAAELCVYTNNQFRFESLPGEDKAQASQA